MTRASSELFAVTLRRAITVAGLAWCLCLPIAACAETLCSSKEAAAAEQEAAGLRDWHRIHESYLRYGKCDDGSVAEGYSESISVVLEEKWTDLPKLAALTDRDARFLEFVLKHLDESVPAKRLAAIKAHAREHCAPNLSTLCGRIASAIQAMEDRYKGK